jgi:hypothetical protein
LIEGVVVLGRVLSGRGKTPLSGSFQPVSAGSDPFQFESFPMYGDVMTEPAQRGQMFGIVVASVGAGLDVVDLEPIAGMVSFDGAAPVSSQDVSSDLVRNRLRRAQIEQLPVVSHADHFDHTITQDLL